MGPSYGLLGSAGCKRKDHSVKASKSETSVLTNVKKVTVIVFPHADELTLCLAWFGCLLLIGLQLFLSRYR